MGLSDRSDILLIAASTVIIIFAIVITATVQQSSSPAATQTTSFSKVVTVGPVWNGDVWTCNSNRDAMVYGNLRGVSDDAQLTLAIAGVGTQSLLDLEAGSLETFSIGVPAGAALTITRTGVVTGFISMQTATNADASCTQ